MVMVINKLANKISARKIQITIGVLWLINGLLQLQPKMMTDKFADKVILPVATGQPGIISEPVHFAVNLILSNPILFDVCFGLIQLTIGLLILNKKTLKVGLIASIVWGVGVWIFGEGAGGIFGGHSLLLTGAPGAALIYALISLGVYPFKSSAKKPAAWLKYAWLGLWVVSGLLMLWSEVTPLMLSKIVEVMSVGAPHWIRVIDNHVATWLAAKAKWQLLIAVLIYFMVGLSALAQKNIQFAGILIGTLIALFFWLVGQNMGGYYTGLATDLNTAPLIILLGLSVLGG